MRLAPSFTNPSMFRCVPGSTFFSPHHCHPGDLQTPTAFGPTETPVAGDVGGTVPATLSLTLGDAADVRRVHRRASRGLHGLDDGDGDLDRGRRGADGRPTRPHLMNGSFSLPSPLAVLFSKSAWTGPVSNDAVTVTFKQHIGATDALRTGAYSKTLTFTPVHHDAVALGRANVKGSDPLQVRRHPNVNA